MFFQSECPSVRSQVEERKKNGGQDHPVNRGTKRRFYQRRKNAMYKIYNKKTIQTRLRARKEMLKKSTDFRHHFFRNRAGEGARKTNCQNKEKPNLEPSTRRVFGE